MGKEKIVDKIRKCLALSNSPNEHEAKLALLKAQKMMADNDIYISEVNTDTEDFEVVTDKVESGTEYEPNWAVKFSKGIS